jgi:lysophospholipase L1-like esterase
MKQYIFYLFLFATLNLFSQDGSYPYAADIQKFKESDKLDMPPKGVILFMGSSSFTMWQDVQDYFPGYRIINRGFGGSTLLDQIHYFNDIVVPYFPMQIVIYCGENDLAYSDTVTSAELFGRFRKLFGMIRAELPDVKITYVSMKPSPSRWNMAGRFMEGNRLIREFLQTEPNTSFVDVWDDMLDQGRRPIPSIFLADSLHMNAEGYKIWQAKIGPELVRW